MTIFIGIMLFISGLVFGAIFIWIIRQREISSIIKNEDNLKEAFGNLSREALDLNQKTFLERAKSEFGNLSKESNQQLNEKKNLIDSTIKDMKSDLENLTKQTSELRGQMVESRAGITHLSDTTAKLSEILSSSQARGQWGEKMVEDILDFMGLMEGVNFEKQAQEGSGRPDFTFKLPQGRRINMDVKFPWSHYATLFSVKTEEEKIGEKKQFLADVKTHVKTIAKREYIDPAGGTVDYVLMFIPNEGIYAYLNKEGEGIIDFAMRQKVILCSPITFYAVLSLIRQSVDNFKMETRASELQALIQDFKSQWEKFTDKMDRVGKSLEQAQNHYHELETTRVRQIEKPVEKILDLDIDQKLNPELMDKTE
jgi:DNA recombination protein RmuC